MSDTISKLDITKILAHTKYRLPISKDIKAVYVVDISKAADLILELLNGHNIKL